jgi:hypothetical protein
MEKIAPAMADDKEIVAPDNTSEWDSLPPDETVDYKAKFEVTEQRLRDQHSYFAKTEALALSKIKEDPSMLENIDDDDLRNLLTRRVFSETKKEENPYEKAVSLWLIKKPEPTYQSSNGNEDNSLRDEVFDLLKEKDSTLEKEDFQAHFFENRNTLARAWKWKLTESEIQKKAILITKAELGMITNNAIKEIKKDTPPPSITPVRKVENENQNKNTSNEEVAKAIFATMKPFKK